MNQYRYCAAGVCRSTPALHVRCLALAVIARVGPMVLGDYDSGVLIYSSSPACNGRAAVRIGCCEGVFSLPRFTPRYTTHLRPAASEHPQRRYRVSNLNRNTGHISMRVKLYSSRYPPLKGPIKRSSRKPDPTIRHGGVVADRNNETRKVLWRG